LPRTQGHRR